MPGLLAYRLLAAVTGAFLLLFGFVLICGFLDRTLFQIFSRPLFATDAWGYYMVGIAGSGSIVWAAALIALARRPHEHHGVATATTIGLVLGAVLRLLAWYSAEYRPAGDQLRLESAVFLVAALGFLWLRPPRPEPPVA
jgi:hypothetical protein